MFWLALAASFGLPVPANSHAPDIRAIFSADDFPTYLLQATHLKSTVYTRTTVRPDGTIDGCVVEVSSADPRLDAYTCALIVKRAKFLPAHWVDGSEVYGVFRLPVRWTVSDAPLPEEDLLREDIADLNLTVDHMPKHARSIVSLSLQIAADENGKAVDCINWEPPKNGGGRQFPELAPIACQQVMAHFSAVPPVDGTGNRVRSVQTVSVHFQANH